ncbi:MAG: YbjP/YqhG family protein [Pseudomonadota bacterium]|nr:YbjP/YqhG family protein [Pseudomonadota bacterium]
MKCLLGIAFALVSLPAAAQSAEDARIFVGGLYAAYQSKIDPDYVGKQAGKVFAPRLLALLRNDQKAAQGEVGAIDGDPICDCQDHRISAVEIAIEPVQSGRTRAVVRFRNSGQRKRLVLDLQSVAGQWRVSDVHGEQLPSLVKLLSPAR